MCGGVFYNSAAGFRIRLWSQPHQNLELGPGFPVRTPDSHLLTHCMLGSPGVLSLSL